MRNSCPYHFLSKRRCDPYSCTTRQAYGVNAMLTQTQYSIFEAIHSDKRLTREEREFVKKQADEIFTENAPDAQKAVELFLKELEDHGIETNPKNLEVKYRTARAAKSKTKEPLVSVPSTSTFEEPTSPRKYNLRDRSPTFMIVDDDDDMTSDDEYDSDESQYSSQEVQEIAHFMITIPETHVRCE